MTQSDKERGDHYAVAVENLAPTKIVCACNAVFTGDKAVAEMKAHMSVQAAIVELEQELERRNVFDQKDRDEESP